MKIADHIDLREVKKAGWLLFGAFVLSTFVNPFDQSATFTAITLLFLGWLSCLVEPPFKIVPSAVLSAAVALLIAFSGLLLIARAFGARRRLFWGAPAIKTASLTVLILQSSIAFLGVSRGVTWLATVERLTTSSGVRPGRMSAYAARIEQAEKSISYGLRLYAEEHKNGLPDSLEALIPAYLSDRELFFLPPASLRDSDDVPEPLRYFGGHVPGVESPVIILASPQLAYGRRVVLQANGSTMQIHEAEYQKRLAQQHDSDQLAD